MLSEGQSSRAGGPPGSRAPGFTSARGAAAPTGAGGPWVRKSRGMGERGVEPRRGKALRARWRRALARAAGAAASGVPVGPGPGAAQVPGRWVKGTPQVETWYVLHGTELREWVVPPSRSEAEAAADNKGGGHRPARTPGTEARPPLPPAPVLLPASASASPCG